MSQFSTAKMSSKGQVVIPEDVRNACGFQTGSQFVVIGDKGVVILKVIQPPAIDQFESLIKKARTQAKKAGLKKSDITAAIKKVRQPS